MSNRSPCPLRMARFDLWLMPVPMLPRAHGYYNMALDIATYDDTRMGPDCCFTAPFNASGSPAISAPMGFVTGRFADRGAVCRA